MSSKLSEAEPLPFGMRFSELGLANLADHVLTHAPSPGAGVRMLATANVDHIVRLDRDADFRAAYRFAWKVTADGMPVYLYARMRGVKLPGRVTGADLFDRLMTGLDPIRHRPFFVVANDAIASALKTYLVARHFPADAVSAASPAYGFEKDQAQSQSLADAIGRHGATHVFVCVGAPKSEIWIHQHRHDLGDCYAFPVGAAAEFFVGVKQRAPASVQALGMEWIWRLLSEPKRLARRYLVDAWKVLAIMSSDMSMRSRRRPAASRLRPLLER
jgi:N-acetylglucosaminyldiphosphoundecaprenol N-acetyl-beta-D-mannosaminyltransferase